MPTTTNKQVLADIFIAYLPPRMIIKAFCKLFCEKANLYIHSIPIGKRGDKALYDKDFKEYYFLSGTPSLAFTFVYILSTKKNSAKSHKIKKG